MLSRATELDGLLISRLCTRAELGRGPPQFLLDELERVRGVEEASLRNLEAYIRRVWPEALGDLWSILSTISDEYMLQDSTPVVSASPKHTSPGQHQPQHKGAHQAVTDEPFHTSNHAAPP